MIQTSAAPPLPEEPLEFDEACTRLEAAFDLVGNADEAEEELSASGATILEDSDQLTVDLLTEDEFFFFAVAYILQAWFAMVPRGCRAPEVEFANLEIVFASNMVKIQSSANATTARELESFVQSGPQPALITALLGGFLEAIRHTPKKLRPSMVAQSVTLALLKSIVEILDEALRRR